MVNLLIMSTKTHAIFIHAEWSMPLLKRLLCTHAFALQTTLFLCIEFTIRQLGKKLAAASSLGKHSRILCRPSPVWESCLRYFHNGVSKVWLVPLELLRAVHYSWRYGISWSLRRCLIDWQGGSQRRIKFKDVSWDKHRHTHAHIGPVVSAINIYSTEKPLVAATGISENKIPAPPLNSWDYFCHLSATGLPVGEIKLSKIRPK